LVHWSIVAEGPPAADAENVVKSPVTPATNANTATTTIAKRALMVAERF
jgi:hypothetical protein